MLAFPSSWRVFLAVEPVDMRKHFDGLWAQAEQHLGEDPRSGALFVFTNKDRNRIKILYFDGTGVWIFAKTHALHCPQRFHSEGIVSVPSAFGDGTRIARLSGG